MRLLQVIHVLSEAEGSLLCHGLSPSIFRPESQSRPPSLQDGQSPSFSKRRRYRPEKTWRLSLALTWGSCVCRSLRSSCLCRVCLCLRSATIQDGTVRRPSQIQIYMLLFVVTYLTVSVWTHSPRAVAPVHRHVVLVTAPIPVVKVLITFLPGKVWAAVAVVHSHTFIGPVVFPDVGQKNRSKTTFAPGSPQVIKLQSVASFLPAIHVKRPLHGTAVLLVPQLLLLPPQLFALPHDSFLLPAPLVLDA